MLSPTSIGGATSGNPRRDEAESERTELGQKDFLKLMTTQISTQDPLNPMENGDFMAQIAQFTAASGIQELQGAFKDFRTDMQGDQALRTATLIGRDVVVESDHGWLGEEGELTGSVSLPAPVENLTVTLSDGAGQPLRRLELGPRPAGVTEFSWDGLDEEGARVGAGGYRIDAWTEVEGEAQSLQTLVDARVNSVAIGRGGEPPRLTLEGLGELSLAAVSQVK